MAEEEIKQGNRAKGGSGENKRKNTRSYKHVQLERKRPQLTRGEDEGRAPSRQGKRSGGSSAAGKDPKAKLKVIPLGGLDAIGKNMTVFECKGDMIIDDAGLMFPDDDHPGVDLILPDYTYVLENADKLRGIVITHGHEDHTGTLPYLLKDLDRKVPIYATKLTLGLIEGKLAEHRVKNAKLIEIKPGQQVKLGCITAEFFAVNHSIPGAVGVFFQSPAGNVLHTGDFKLDQSPIDGVHTDFGALARFSKIGVDLMMSDSTNAMNPNFTRSEAEVGKVLAGIISQATGRVIIASFASHIHRMQQICDAAIANGRKVVVTGRSMIQNTDIARRLGYLHISDDDLIDAYDLKGIPPEKIVIMCTGSQGEPLSALARRAALGARAHRQRRAQDHRHRRGRHGHHLRHARPRQREGGHPRHQLAREDRRRRLRQGPRARARVRPRRRRRAEACALHRAAVLSIVQPRNFMPVHGEATHLRAHAKLAQDVGIPEENVFICENGEGLELSAKGVRRGDYVQSGIVYVDGLSVGDTSQDVLDERTTLGSQGIAIATALVDARKKEVAGPVSVETHGITGGDDPDVLDDLAYAVKRSLTNALGKGGSAKDWERACRQSLQTALWERTKQKPMVIATVLEAPRA